MNLYLSPKAHHKQYEVDDSENTHGHNCPTFLVLWYDFFFIGASEVQNGADMKWDIEIQI